MSWIGSTLFEFGTNEYRNTPCSDVECGLTYSFDNGMYVGVEL